MSRRDIATMSVEDLQLSVQRDDPLSEDEAARLRARMGFADPVPVPLGDPETVRPFDREETGHPMRKPPKAEREEDP